MSSTVGTPRGITVRLGGVIVPPWWSGSTGSVVRRAPKRTRTSRTACRAHRAQIPLAARTLHRTRLRNDHRRAAAQLCGHQAPPARGQGSLAPEGPGIQQVVVQASLSPSAQTAMGLNVSSPTLRADSTEFGPIDGGELICGPT